MADEDEDNEFFSDQLGDINADAVAMDMAAKAVVEMYKTFKKQGLSMDEAASLTAEMVRRGGSNNG